MSEHGRTCIFCSATPVTRAHLFGQALARLLPPVDGGWTQHSHAIVGHDDGSISLERKFIDASDHPILEQQVRRMCEPCNRDWMGGIEARTRVPIARMAQMVATTLSEQEAADIALWITLVSMLRTTMEPRPWAYSLEEMHSVRVNGRPPEQTRVWLGRGEPAAVRDRHQRVESGHLSYFWIGHLIVLITTGGATPAFRRKLGQLPGPAPGLEPIFPRKGGMRWQPDGAFSRDELIGLTNLE